MNFPFVAGELRDRIFLGNESAYFAECASHKKKSRCVDDSGFSCLQGAISARALLNCDGDRDGWPVFVCRYLDCALSQELPVSGSGRN